jgi:branched-chain amino acid transport system permease protein
MITIMLMRPRGLWPSPEHGKSRKPATDIDTKAVNSINP